MSNEESINDSIGDIIKPEGSMALVPSAFSHVTGVEDTRSGELYQTSLMTALLEGVYEGEVTYGELHQHGDFGLGTFNSLDGEMIGLDGVFYQLKSDGTACIVAPDQKTPFAVVTFFRPETTIELSTSLDKQALSAKLSEMFSDNLFIALRIEGRFHEVKTRTVALQKRPFPPLTEATAHQQINTFTDVEGTLAGFRTPHFAQGIGVAGLHLHFIRKDRKAGGHALDFSLESGALSLEQVTGLHVELPSTRQFEEADLQAESIDSSIRASEG
jgi:acetolactate decarboxylase